MNSLVPVFALIALGATLRKTAFLNEQITVGLNKIAYWIALPVLLFYKLSQATITAGNTGQIFQTLCAATVCSAVITWMLARLIRAPMKSTGVMIQAALRGNLAFVGLPIVLFTCKTLPAADRAALESSIVLAMTLVIIVYSILCVCVLVYFNREEGAKLNPRDFWMNVLKNPLAIGCIAGVVVNQLGLPIPLILARTCEALSPAAFPMALLGIGSQLAATQVRSHINWAILASVVKTIVSPLVGYFVGRIVGLSGIELTVAVLFCAMPTAVSSYILAEQMNVDPDLAASAVVICTVMSFFSLTAILLIPL